MWEDFGERFPGGNWVGIKQSNYRGSEFSSYEIELRNRVTPNDVILRVTNSKIFIEILHF